MNLKLLFNTIKYLKPMQIIGQIYNRFNHQRLKLIVNTSCQLSLKAIPILKPDCLINNRFCFLNITSDFTFWNEKQYGMLWAYNLNYMDWLLQRNIEENCCIKWIDKFIHDSHQNKIGFEPYPTSLRCMNWIKFFSLHSECKSNERDTFLYSQLILLSKKIEYHLMGNHLLEDAFALYMGSIYFQDNHLHRISKHILFKELNKQILEDGAHFEQSPMYHCIMLDRLLDCINMTISSSNEQQNDSFLEMLKTKAIKMLGHLENMTWEDRTIPLFNDASYNIAPSANELFEYANRLNLTWSPITLNDCGYRHFISEQKELFVDIGNVCASYQPGHSHADTFTYEMRIYGKPFIIDTGISTYDKNSRRDYERSTHAHNTVSIKDMNSSQTWDGFRVGNRANVTVLSEGDTFVNAVHNGFGRGIEHNRNLSIKDNQFIIEDMINDGQNGISYIHFAPTVVVNSFSNSFIDTNMVRITLLGASSVTISKGQASTEFNKLVDICIAKIEFHSHLIHTIE